MAMMTASDIEELCEDKEKILIDIPADGNYIEIMGHRIDGYGGFDEFIDDLNECKDAQHRWNMLKVFLMKYRREKSGSDTDVDGRYCVAMSITDILNKMEELEKEY